MYLSMNELSILVLLWMIGIVTFGSIIYYADSSDNEVGPDGEQVVSARVLVSMTTRYQSNVCAPARARVCAQHPQCDSVWVCTCVSRVFVS